MAVNASAGSPTSIDPEKLYSLAEFIRCSGLSYSRIRRAAHDGVEIPSLTVGRRKFVEGSSGIAYIRHLAARHCQRQIELVEIGESGDQTPACDQVATTCPNCPSPKH